MKALIVAFPNHHDHELIYPYYRLREEFPASDVVIMSQTKGKFCGLMGTSMTATASTDELKDTTLRSEYFRNFQLLVLPGGVKSMEKLRQEKHVISFISEWVCAGKLTASTCSAAQLLISARVVKGRKISAYYAIEEDVINAGATYVNSPVVIDGNIISSPHYDFLGEWMGEVIKALKTRESIHVPAKGA